MKFSIFFLYDYILCMCNRAHIEKKKTIIFQLSVGTKVINEFPFSDKFKQQKWYTFKRIDYTTVSASTHWKSQ